MIYLNNQIVLPVFPFLNPLIQINNLISGSIGDFDFINSQFNYSLGCIVRLILILFLTSYKTDDPF